MKREKKDKLNVVIFIIIAAVVVLGWIFGFTSKESELNQAFRIAPWYMNVIGILWTTSFAIITYMFATEKWSVGNLKFNSLPVIVSILLGIVGGILLAANFFNGAF